MGFLLQGFRQDLFIGFGGQDRDALGNKKIPGIAWLNIYLFVCIAQVEDVLF